MKPTSRFRNAIEQLRSLPGFGIRQIVTVGLVVGAVAVLNFLYHIFVGRSLGVAEYGNFAVGVSMATFLAYAAGPIASVATLNFSRHAGRGDRRALSDYSRRTSTIVALSAVAGAIIVIPISGWLAVLFRVDRPAVIFTAYVIAALLVMLSIPRSLLRGTLHFGRYALNLFFEGVLRLGAGMLLVGGFPTAVSALGGYIAGSSGALGIALLQVRGALRRGTAERNDANPMPGRGIPFFFLGWINAALQNADLLLVKLFFVPSEAGIYAAAWAIARTFAALAMPFDVVLLPIAGRLGSSGSAARLAGAIAGGLVLLASIPLTLLWIWPDVIVRGLYGNPFAEAGQIVVILALAVLTTYLTYFVGQVLLVRGRSWFLALNAAGLAAELAMIARWHQTLEQVAVIHLSTQATIFVLVVIVMIFSFRGRKQPGT